MSQTLLQRLKHLLHLWQQEELTHDVSHLESRFWRVIYFLILVGKLFVRNRGPVRASALAYTTILAIVPVLAMVISVSTSILKGRDTQISGWVDQGIAKLAPALNLQQVGDADEAAMSRETVARNIKSYINNVQSGTLGASAAAALIFVGISLLATIEGAFNDMWGVTRGRSWFARVVQYWAAMTLGPFFLLIPLGVVTGSRFSAATSYMDDFPVIGWLKFTFAPLLVLTVAFAIFYKVMPNTRVKWSAAFLGGAVGGALFQINYSASILYASKAVTYSKIYGSLGAVPLLLASLYLAWLIVLLGSQVGYAWQNRHIYREEKIAHELNQRGREFIALRMMTHAAEQFQKGAPAPSRSELARILSVPSQLIGDIAQTLLEARLVVEVSDDECRLIVARPLEAITFGDILEAMRVTRGQSLPTTDDPGRTTVLRRQQEIIQAEFQTARTVTLASMTQGVSATATNSGSTN